MIIRHEHAIVLDEGEQVRHLLKVRGHVRVVAEELGVVELHAGHVFDTSAG